MRCNSADGTSNEGNGHVSEKETKRPTDGKETYAKEKRTHLAERRDNRDGQGRIPDQTMDAVNAERAVRCAANQTGRKTGKKRKENRIEEHKQQRGQSKLKGMLVVKTRY